MFSPKAKKHLVNEIFQSNNVALKCEIRLQRVKYALSASSIYALTAISMVATPHWGDSSLSIDLTSDEISATGGHQRFALERFTLLVSDDSFRSLPAMQNSPLGYRFLRSPGMCKLLCFTRGMAAEAAK